MGVRGIRLRGDDRVVSMAIVDDEGTLMSICENGHGKRTSFSEYKAQRRGGMGVTNIKTSKRNGEVVAVRTVMPDEEIILITEKGMIVRTPTDTVRCIGRATQGVKVISTADGDRVSAVAIVPPDEEDPEGVEGEEVSEVSDVPDTQEAPESTEAPEAAEQEEAPEE